MKNKYILRIVFIFAAFCLIGCYTAPKKAVPVRYSFAGSDEKSVPIVFIKEKKMGVYLVDCEGKSLPMPAEGTYWEQDKLFPVGRPLNLRVYIYWNEDQYGERRRGIFKCPPLQEGREYKLWFRGNLKGGKIILTYSNVSSLSYSSKGEPQFEIVYEQIIPPPPK